MFFFKKKPKPVPVEPDTTRIRLYNGAFYPYDSAPAPYRVYTLRDWDEDEDCDFPQLAMDCALAILDEYPVVVNCLRPLYLDDNFLRNKDSDVINYLKSISWTDFGWRSSVVTMTNGPDRNLISTQSISDESVLFTFYAYRHLPAEGTLPGTPFVPDVKLQFAHLHTRLIITTTNGIEIYADKIRTVCEKYGKTLVVQELSSKEKGPL